MNEKQREEQKFDGKLIITASCVLFFMIFAVIAYKYDSFYFWTGCLLGIFFATAFFILMHIVDKK